MSFLARVSTGHLKIRACSPHHSEKFLRPVAAALCFFSRFLSIGAVALQTEVRAHFIRLRVSRARCTCCVHVQALLASISSLPMALAHHKAMASDGYKAASIAGHKTSPTSNISSNGYTCSSASSTDGHSLLHVLNGGDLPVEVVSTTAILTHEARPLHVALAANVHPLHKCTCPANLRTIACAHPLLPPLDSPLPLPLPLPLDRDDWGSSLQAKRRICPHKRQRSKCKECGGLGICSHGRQKQQCKECGGSSICPHGTQKRFCKGCGGSGLCPHDRQKQLCKECGGSSICSHGRQKNHCKDCGYPYHSTNRHTAHCAIPRCRECKHALHEASAHALHETSAHAE